MKKTVDCLVWCDADMEKIGFIGHFGYGKHLINGQTIKTNVITEELKKY